MYNENRIGPKVDPYGTPQSASDKGEWQLSRDTNS